MRIYTDRLTRDVFAVAAARADVGLHRLNEHRSRTRAAMFDVIVSGSGRTGGQWGHGDYRAATWDEWGIFLAELFRQDPDALCAAYAGGEHFRWVTGTRFDDLTIDRQHIRHKWEYQGDCVTRAYSVHECACGAIKRQLMTDYTWADISGEEAPQPAVAVVQRSTMGETWRPEPTIREQLAALRAETAELHRQADAEEWRNSAYASEGWYERDYLASLVNA